MNGPVGRPDLVAAYLEDPEVYAVEEARREREAEARAANHEFWSQRHTPHNPPVWNREAVTALANEYHRLERERNPIPAYVPPRVPLRVRFRRWLVTKIDPDAYYDEWD
jgi:N-methylhydantoinase A/oxoprolinase/acetone carboxylase beta subunit